jgi:hypothetical protein
MKRSETEATGAVMTAAAQGGQCKRAGCPAPLPAQRSGRAWQFCSDEWRRRHYNALRGGTPAAPSAAADGAGAALARLGQLLAEAARLTAGVAAQVADAAPERVAVQAAEAEAAPAGPRPAPRSPRPGPRSPPSPPPRPRKPPTPPRTPGPPPKTAPWPRQGKPASCRRRPPPWPAGSRTHCGPQTDPRDSAFTTGRSSALRKARGHHLLIRRSLLPGEKGRLELAFFRCWSPRSVTLPELTAVAHRHITLAMLACAFLAATARAARPPAGDGAAPAEKGT